MSSASGLQRVVLFTEDDPLVLDGGQRLGHVEVAYETWGELNADASNAVFVCHALTGDAHAHGTEEARGWWEPMVGPGRPIDTDRFFVICPNLLGGCAGTTGPSSIDASTGRVYGLDFPLLSVRDFVTVHRALLRHLGIARLLACAGGSLGGMQALQWALDAPHEVAHAVVVAASSRLSAQNIAFSAVARSAIMRDPDFADGRYLDPEHAQNPGPRTGLAIARMMAHITYLSEQAMAEKFGRRIQDAAEPRRRFGVDFAVESYLEHQGRNFLDRFDPLSYLYLTRALDYFDCFEGPHALDRLTSAGPDRGTRFLVLSFDSDWRFGTSHSRRITRVLERARVPTSFREISAPHGHDSFLLQVPEYLDTVAAFLDHAHESTCRGEGGGRAGRAS